MYPVAVHTYDDLLLKLVSDIANVLEYNPECTVILGGDFNIVFVKEMSCREVFKYFGKSRKLKLCDSKVVSPIRITYRSKANGSESFIDHFFVNEALFAKVQTSEIIDSGVNLSDHLPLVLHFSESFLNNGDVHSKRAPDSVKSGRLRWDKADLVSYYHATNLYLNQIDPSMVCTNCNVGCLCVHGDDIDAVYSMIVDGLCQAADDNCPKTTASYYKHYWDGDLTELKHRSIAAHDLWKTCGRPSHGPIHDAKRCAKAEYKRGIRNKKALEDTGVSNDLHEYLLAKDSNAFWKTWQTKFKTKLKPPLCVDGFSDPTDIANVFATNFKAACSPNNEYVNNKLKEQFQKKFSQYNPASSHEVMSVELVDQCIRKMKLGKAPGLDGIETEHLVHAHPRLVVLISLLFNQMLVHGRVPSSFGLGIIIPLVKGPSVDKGHSDNYRGITLSSNLSKLFEMCILERFGSYLGTSDLQFGFKKGLGCSHAIHTVKAVVDYFTSHGSTVNVCALDMSKAFDKVNHFALFNKLMDRQVPREVLATLISWYSLSSAAVRWGSILSDMITLTCGVRQGGVLSPVLFAVYVDEIIEKLNRSSHGCRIGDMFLGCVMYADDLILISASLCDLQAMVDICSVELQNLDMKLNVAKSQVIRIGTQFHKVCKNLSVNGVEVNFVSKLKYLGCFLVSAKSFKLSMHEMRVKFYRAFNSLYSKCHKFSEHVLLHLVNAHCKPFLLYGLEAISPNKRELSSLEYTYSSAICKIFKICHSSVASILHFMNEESIVDCCVSRKLRFMQKGVLHVNTVVRFLSCFSSTLSG